MFCNCAAVGYGALFFVYSVLCVDPYFFGAVVDLLASLVIKLEEEATHGIPPDFRGGRRSFV